MIQLFFAAKVDIAEVLGVVARCCFFKQSGEGWGCVLCCFSVNFMWRFCWAPLHKFITNPWLDCFSNVLIQWGVKIKEPLGGDAQKGVSSREIRICPKILRSSWRLPLKLPWWSAPMVRCLMHLCNCWHQSYLFYCLSIFYSILMFLVIYDSAMKSFSK